MSNLRDAVGLRLACDNKYQEVEFEFDPASSTLWGYMRPRGNPCFSLAMLKEIKRHGERLQANGGHVAADGTRYPVSYYVGASRVPRVFNLGGDLALFLLLIKARDRDALAHYARLCVDNVYTQIGHYGCPGLTTISLVQGDALGGGFEMALTADVLVAEESAQLGLPEMLFNLFPGMGAYSLLARRVGARQAEELIMSGRVLSARQLHEMGIVDVLAKDGQGESAVSAWIAHNSRRRNGMLGVYRARQHVFPITRQELDGIAETWVDCALRLQDRDLRMMSRVVQAQMRRMEECDVDDITAEALKATG